MKLALMQPYFFPYLGYFDLINYSDQWIVFDTVQYSRLGWSNRNRILHPTDGWQYIIVPLKKHRLNTPIMDVEVSKNHNWKRRIIGQLQHYKKNAPYFHETIQLIEECFQNDELSLSKLNVSILDIVCRHIGVTFNYSFLSEMNLNIGEINETIDWSLNIAKAMDAEEYVNPPGGKKLYEASKFTQHNIKLTIREKQPCEYSCKGYFYEPHLSIVDVLMWNSAKRIQDFLNDTNC